MAASRDSRCLASFVSARRGLDCMACKACRSPSKSTNFLPLFSIFLRISGNWPYNILSQDISTTTTNMNADVTFTLHVITQTINICTYYLRKNWEWSQLTHHKVDECTCHPRLNHKNIYSNETSITTSHHKPDKC